MLSHKEIEKFHSVAQAIKVEEGVRMYKIVSSCFRFSSTLKSNPLHLTSNLLKWPPRSSRPKMEKRQPYQGL